MSGPPPMCPSHRPRITSITVVSMLSPPGVSHQKKKDKKWQHDFHRASNDRGDTFASGKPGTGSIEGLFFFKPLGPHSFLLLVSRSLVCDPTDDAQVGRRPLLSRSPRYVGWKLTDTGTQGQAMMGGESSAELQARPSRSAHRAACP